MSDLDEIGAIAQRLKNEQGSGSWIIIPQQGTIPVDAKLPVKPTLSKEQISAVVNGVQEVAEGFRAEIEGDGHDDAPGSPRNERPTACRCLHAALKAGSSENDFSSYPDVDFARLGTARVKLEQTRAVLGEVWKPAPGHQRRARESRTSSRIRSDQLGKNLEHVEQVIVDFERDLRATPTSLGCTAAALHAD